MKFIVDKLKLMYHWKKKEYLMRKFISKNDKLVESDVQQPIGIFISSWFHTFIPWYSIVLGLLIKIKYKRKLVFIIDDFPYSTDEMNPRYQTKSLVAMGLKLGKFNHVVRLSEQKDRHVDTDIIDEYAKYNTIHDIKRETFSEDEEYYQLMHSQLKSSSSKLPDVLDNYDFDYIVLPGGICFLTGILRELAKKKKTRTCTYDSGLQGTFLLSTGDVAAHLTDIPFSVEHIINNPESDFKYITEQVSTLMKDRFNGTDVFLSQVETFADEQDFSNSILIPLNVSWDSAALGKHKIFDSSINWLINTTQWILKYTNKKVIIRQHPVERFSYGKSNDNYEKILFDHFGLEPRVIFISANDKVNTYNIIKQTDLVITHTSTVALEAAIYGKNVITVSGAYYSNLGIVHAPESRDDYFELINSLLISPRKVSNKDYNSAIVAYYVSQKLNWHFPDFLPSGNVEFWLNSDLESIYQMSGTKEVLQSIDAGVPLSITNYRKYNE